MGVLIVSGIVDIIAQSVSLCGMYLILEVAVLRSFETFLNKKGSLKPQYIPYYLKWVQIVIIS